jgi:hypothetical protein
LSVAGELRSRARAETAHAARYMTQLAKHWGHKYEVAFDERQARIALPIGLCLMAAAPDGLEVTVEAADEETLTRLEGVVARHLARFSFREPDLVLDWTRLA